ncbi:helix-turn-helix domain-containing protein [Streptomyces kronopolitis]|uniref:helix-turn-helix domain-containing protein n=1 Tax=Streptomyces kronopolitis TaxID=1612435 RepID=UPI0020BF3F43|nr:helix-turn-helix domain-containing protein [Streptomyces kronopolitis]MCL6300485.1 helix-turn-helix domain-containing protein [Streptomyces kronopolitis]
MAMTAAATAMQPRLYKVEVAAKLCGIGRSTAYEEIRLGRLRTVRVGRRRLIPLKYIDEYVELLMRESEAVC